MERKWAKYLDNKERRFGQYIPWTKEEEIVLRENYEKSSSVELHKKFFSNRSFFSVEKR